MKMSKVNGSAICKSCLTNLELARDVRNSDNKPEEGDFTICINCGEVSRFTANLMMDLATDIEMDMLKEEDPESYKLVIAASRIIKTKSYE